MSPKRFLSWVLTVKNVAPASSFTPVSVVLCGGFPCSVSAGVQLIRCDEPRWWEPTALSCEGGRDHRYQEDKPFLFSSRVLCGSLPTVGALGVLLEEWL